MNENLLQEVYRQALQKVEPVSWSLQETPPVEFYKLLHGFLTKSSLTNCASKTVIGRLYMAIDPNLQSNVSRPDNAYRYIERIVASESACHPSASMMTYGNEIKTLNAKVNEQADQIKKLMCDLNLIKQELEKTRQELKSTKHALSNITNELATAKKQQHHSNQQVQKWKQAYESMKSDCILIHEI